MDNMDIVIVGAGPSGLIAAYELSKAGKKILLLEARDRIGGRTFTTQPKHFSQPIETGAEFVHGQLPITLGLLEKAHLNYHLMDGESYTVRKGKLQAQDEFITDWDLLIEQLKTVEKDITINEFLATHFAEERYSPLKEQVRGFVQGFDSADPDKASTISLRTEWENDDQEHQYRIDNGYSSLMQWLAVECEKNGVVIKLSSPVKNVRWNAGGGEIITAAKERYLFQKAIFSVPLGIWQCPAESIAAISFEPLLTNKIIAAKQMGYGGVVKINIECSEAIWATKPAHKMTDAGFIFSDAEFPTWWTQNPAKNTLLTGWIAGPQALEISRLSNEQIEQKAIDSLAYIFETDTAFVREKIVACAITNWVTDPFAKGAYSYETLQSSAAREILKQPVADTLFFIGEALYKGIHTGTVEAAFATGLEVANQLLKN